jgi:predicted 3-demethylubiquinone-9 3-methyltransferase (glyoxalase superfamily)
MTQPAQTIIPHLWFDKAAHEAAQYYVSIFPESNINKKVVIPYTPSGDTETVSFKLWGNHSRPSALGPCFRSIRRCLLS